MNLLVARRSILALGGALALPLRQALAQPRSYPQRPVRIIVPFAPGSVTDIILRQIGQRLSERLGQPFVVENRTGAGGMIGYDAVAKSRPDGYTLGGTIATFVTNRYVYRNVPYDELRDFVPVATFSRTPMVLVVGSGVQAADLATFRRQVQARPGELSYAATSASNQLNAELLFQRLGVQLQVISYRDGGQAMNDVIAGRVAASLTPANVAVPQLQGGQLRALAVTSATRFAALAEVPTVKELGLGDVDIWSWQALLAPAGTPEDIVTLLHNEINLVLNDEEFRGRILQQGYVPFATSREEFRDLLRSETEAYGRTAREIGMVPE